MANQLTPEEKEKKLQNKKIADATKKAKAEALKEVEVEKQKILDEAKAEADKIKSDAVSEAEELKKDDNEPEKEEETGERVDVVNSSFTRFIYPKIGVVDGERKQLYSEQIIIKPAEPKIDGSIEPTITKVLKSDFKKLVNEDVTKAKVLTKEQLKTQKEIRAKKPEIEAKINAATSYEEMKKIQAENSFSEGETFLLRNELPYEG